MSQKIQFVSEIDVDVVIDEIKNNVHLDLILDCFDPDNLFAYLQRNKGDDWILEQLENRGHSEG